MNESARQTILIVEDDENDVFFLERALGQVRIGNPVTRLKHGEEAIAYLAGSGVYADREKFPLPGLLLLDLKMPRKNGFEVVDWLRQQPGLKRLPVVVLTSSNNQADINHAYELGANSYFVKPVKFEELVELVKTLTLYWLRWAEKPDCTA